MSIRNEFFPTKAQKLILKNKKKIKNKKKHQQSCPT